MKCESGNARRSSTEGELVFEVQNFTQWDLEVSVRMVQTHDGSRLVITVRE